MGDGPTQQVAAAALTAGISIRIHSLRRSGLVALEAALNRWAHEYLQETVDASKGSHPDEELVSGTLGVDASTYASDGLLIWSDTCHPVTHLTGDAAAKELGANLAGLEAVAPLYDRCTNDALVSPPVRGWHSADHAAPSAAAAAAGAGSGASGSAEASTPASGTKGVKRTAAEAGLGDLGSPPTPSAPAAAAAGAAAGGAGTPAAGDVVSPGAKRRFLGYQRCFNCGSYAHGVSGCPQPVDKERIAAAMREDAEGREAAMRSRASRFALGRQRYFDTLGAPAAPDPYEGLRPGCVSAELAEALGMASAGHPPPWLDRMVRLGLPPAYMEEPPAAAAAAEAAAGQGAENRRSSFIVREGDGPDTAAEQGAGEEAGATAAAAAAADEGGGEPTADQHQQQAQPAKREEGAAGGLSESTIQLLQVVVESLNGTAAESQKAEAGVPGGGADSEAAGGEPLAQQPALVCSVVYPGVNGPVPEDPGVRGAWERVLEVAGRVC